MKKEILPAIIAKNQKEFDEMFKKIGKYASTFHLDVMHKNFVKNESLNFKLKLPHGKKFQAHLMVKNPAKWILNNSRGVELIFFHYEASKYPLRTINLIKKKRKKVGIVINPATKVSKIKKYLDLIDRVMVMTVHPGQYGAKFLPSALKKVKQIKEIAPRMVVQVDGGMNPAHISLASLAGADAFVTGSYIKKSKNIKKAISILKTKAEKKR